MFSCAGMATGAPGRSISVARVARDSRETMSHDSNIESPAAVAVPIPIPIAGHRGRSVGHAVGRTRGRSDTRPVGPAPTRPRPRARFGRHSCTREQCPLSSLPPSSAASPPSRRPRSKYVQCFFSSIDGGRRPSRDVSRGTTRTGERARGRYDRRARWSCDGRRGTMRSARARGDDERKGFGNIVSAHRLLGRVIARDDRRDDARARARDRTIALDSDRSRVDRFGRWDWIFCVIPSLES